MKLKNIFLGTLVLSSIFGLTSCDLLDKKPVEQVPPQTENNSTNEEKYMVIGPMALTYTTAETITEEKVLKNYSLIDTKNNVVEIGKSEVVGFNNIKQGMVGTYYISVNLYSKENKLYSFNVIIQIIQKVIIQNTCMISVSKTIVDLDTNKKEHIEVIEETVKTDTIEKYLKNILSESQNKEESLDFTIVLKNGSIINFKTMRTENDGAILSKTTLEEVEKIYLHRIMPSVNNACQTSISINNPDGTVRNFNEITRKNTRIRDFYVELITKNAASDTTLKSFEITFNNGYSVTSENWFFDNPNETMMNVKQITLNYNYAQGDGQSATAPNVLPTM